MTEQEIDAAGRDETPEFALREQAALTFAKRLAAEWHDLGLGDFDRLGEHFEPAEVVELVAFAATHYGGMRMMSSWGAEAYKKNERVVLEELPVKLAYADSVKAGAAAPSIPQPPLTPEHDILARAEERHSPPAAWLHFLTANPTVLSTWFGLYEAVVENGILEPRIKQLYRVLVAQRTDFPDWAPADDLSLAQAGVTQADREAVGMFRLDAFTPREAAALQYAQSLVMSTHVSDEIFDGLKKHFSEAEIAELGFALAVQNGAARVSRALTAEIRDGGEWGA